MKHLILIPFLLIALLGCNEVNPFDADEKVQFNVTTLSKYVADVDVKIKSDYYILDIGKLPMSIKASEGETITAHFRVNVSNFGLNHPQCNCENVGGNIYDCAEDFVVDGSEWEVAK